MHHLKLYTGKAVADGADLALKHRLFVAGWELSSTLRWSRRHAEQNPKSTKHKIALYFVDQIPVAIGFTDGYLVQAFCRKEHRRNGYASKCVQKLEIDDNTRSDVGVRWDGSSRKFWDHLNITMR